MMLDAIERAANADREDEKDEHDDDAVREPHHQFFVFSGDIRSAGNGHPWNPRRDPIAENVFATGNHGAVVFDELTAVHIHVAVHRAVNHRVATEHGDVALHDLVLVYRYRSEIRAAVIDRFCGCRCDENGERYCE